MGSIEATSNIGLQNSTGTGGALLFKGAVPATSTVSAYVEVQLPIQGIVEKSRSRVRWLLKSVPSTCAFAVTSVNVPSPFW